MTLDELRQTGPLADRAGEPGADHERPGAFACARTPRSTSRSRSAPVRADGYHPLETVFQSLALHDTLAVTARRGPFALTCSDPGVPVDARNLVWRAARRLWEALGRRGEPPVSPSHIDEAHPDAGRAWRRQRRCGGGAVGAASPLGADGRRRSIWPRSPPASAPTCRIFLIGRDGARPRPRRRSLPARRRPRRTRSCWRCPASACRPPTAYGWLDADRAAGVAGGAGGGAAGGVASRCGRAATCRVVNDLEAPVFAAPSGDRPASATSLGRRRRQRRGHDRERVRGVRPVRHRRRGPGGRREAVAGDGAMALLTRTVDRRTCQRVHFSFASSSPRHA